MPRASIFNNQRGPQGRNLRKPRGPIFQLASHLPKFSRPNPWRVRFTLRIGGLFLHSASFAETRWCARMAEKEPLPKTDPPADLAPPSSDVDSHSTRSAQETQDYSPIVASETGAGTGSARVKLPADDPGIAPADRYQVRKLLGSGGFGTVSLAYDQLIQREVAKNFQ